MTTVGFSLVVYSEHGLSLHMSLDLKGIQHKNSSNLLA